MIETARLKLISFTDDIANAMFESDQAFAKAISAAFPHNWSEERLAIETFYKDTKDDKENIGWGAYLIILTEENKLIGCCGFKGKPNDSIVEIGYEIHIDYRKRGFAKEAAKALTDFAFKHPQVHKVVAHTLAQENPSTAILKKLGFIFMKQITDPEDGEIWQWQYNCKKQ